MGTKAVRQLSFTAVVQRQQLELLEGQQHAKHVLHGPDVAERERGVFAQIQAPEELQNVCCHRQRAQRVCTAHQPVYCPCARRPWIVCNALAYPRSGCQISGMQDPCISHKPVNCPGDRLARASHLQNMQAILLPPRQAGKSVCKAHEPNCCLDRHARSRAHHTR